MVVDLVEYRAGPFGRQGLGQGQTPGSDVQMKASQMSSISALELAVQGSNVVLDLLVPHQVPGI